jgi:hypothetical protein
MLACNQTRLSSLLGYTTLPPARLYIFFVRFQPLYASRAPHIAYKMIQRGTIPELWPPLVIGMVLTLFTEGPGIDSNIIHIIVRSETLQVGSVNWIVKLCAPHPGIMLAVVVIGCGRPCGLRTLARPRIQDRVSGLLPPSREKLHFELFD